jgi:hypothetical protein
MRKNKVPVVSIILYVIALIMFAYAIWAGIYSAGIVAEAVSLQQLVISGNEFEVISYYMTNVAQSALFAVVLFALGFILQTIKSQMPVEAVMEEEEETFEESLPEETEPSEAEM